MFALLSAIFSYKILQQLFQSERLELTECRPRFGEKKVEFTLLAIIVIFQVFYLKLAIWPCLVAKLRFRNELHVNAVQKRSLDQFNKECETLTKQELAKLLKTPEY